MEKKQKNTIPNIELRSGGVQSLITHNPPFILRYGISILLLVLIVLIGLSKFIRYPHIISAPAEVLRNVSINEYSTMEDCKVLWMKRGIEEKVKAGDTLAILSQIMPNGSDTLIITSQNDGYIYKPEEYTVGQIIHKGVTYMAFSDGVLFDTKKQARSSFEKEYIDQLHVGMLVEIDNKKNEALRINSISKFPDVNGLYNVYYESIDESKSKQLFDEKITVKINIDNTSIFDKLFIDRLQYLPTNRR